MIVEVARARRLVQRQLRHRQRFEIAAHRGDRRRQLVRHVGEQLAAHAVGRGERLGARGEVVGHRVERAGDRGDLVAAAIGRARRQSRRRRDCRAAASSARSRRRAGPKIITDVSTAPSDQHARRDQREHRREAAEQKSERRLRRHDDDAGQPPLTTIGAGRTKRGCRVAFERRQAIGAIDPVGGSARGRSRSDGRSGSLERARPADGEARGSPSRRAGAAGAHARHRDQRLGNDWLPLVITRPSASITKNGCVYCAY